MRIFKISCYSNCGTYFQPYLKSVTVIAETEADAIQILKEYFKKTGKKFIYEEKRWETEIIQDSVLSNSVIDEEIDSDY